MFNPCECIDDYVKIDNTVVGRIAEIKCNDISNDFNLGYISNQLEELVEDQNVVVEINRFTLTNTSITGLKTNIFQIIKFKTIIIKDNKLLEMIHPSAFSGSINSLEKIIIMNSPRLSNEHPFDRDIFNFLSKFTNLKELRVKRTSITSIPSNAFYPANGVQYQLKHIEFSENKIREIGDFAFANLPAGWLDIILNSNNINKIGSHSFKFHKESEEVVNTINLNDNQISAEFIANDAFTNMKRPIGTLYLRRNKIETLKENIFAPLFIRSQKSYFRLEVEGNKLTCDCSLSWLFTTKYCYSQEAQSKDALVIDQISGVKCSRDDLYNCNVIDSKLSPSCTPNHSFNIKESQITLLAILIPCFFSLQMLNLIY